MSTPAASASLFDQIDLNGDGSIDKREFGLAQSEGLLPPDHLADTMQSLLTRLGHPEVAPLLIKEKLTVEMLRKMTKEDLRSVGLPMGVCIAIYEWSRHSR